MDFIVIYIIGILVARLQLQHWFKDRLMTEDDCMIVAILSALSWTIYPAYCIELVLQQLKVK